MEGSMSLMEEVNLGRANSRTATGGVDAYRNGKCNRTKGEFQKNEDVVFPVIDGFTK